MEFIIVIVFNKGVSVPRQAKFNKTYYWRNGSASEPAPHYYLDLLWNQETKALLAIDTWKAHLILDPHRKTGSSHMNWIKLEVTFMVKNISFSCATLWGILFVAKPKSCVSGQPWSSYPPNQAIRPNHTTLLPGESYPIKIELTKNLDSLNSKEIGRQIEQALKEIAFEIIPVSNNHMAKSIKFDFEKSKVDVGNSQQVAFHINVIYEEIIDPCMECERALKWGEKWKKKTQHCRP